MNPAILLLVFVVQVTSIAIDNGIAGVPEISCMDDMIMFSFNTEKSFTGRVYVKGRSDETNCIQSFPSNTAPTGSFSVRLTACGMRRFRSMTPEGMYMMITVVVGFHPIFVTKVDRAYRLQCLFRSPEVTVTRSIDVSMINTTPLGGDGAEAECKYDIRRGSPDGPVLRYAVIGEKAFHVWECTMGDDMMSYGMLVYDCVASDMGAKKMVRIVDTKGCVVDPILLETVNYDPQKTRAFAMTHIYKYADRAAIQFQCNIKMCNKADGDCSGLTPPNCPGPTRGTFSRSRTRGRQRQVVKRSLRPQEMHYELMSDDGMTVGSDEITVLDSFFDKSAIGHMLRGENITDPKTISERRALLDIVDLMGGRSTSNSQEHQRGICVPPTMYNVMMCATLFSFLLCSLSVIVLFVKLIVRLWSYKGKQPNDKSNLGWLPGRWGAWAPWSFPQQSQPPGGPMPMGPDSFADWMTGGQFRQTAT